jgi:hypothetical protein
MHLLALYAAVFVPATAQSQASVRRNRGVIVPRVIRGQAVESAVINGVVLVFGELPVAGEKPADDAPVEQPPKPNQRVALFSGTFDELVYGRGSNAAGAQARLEVCLEQKLDKLDRIVGLTDAQRQKLQLAGRGDLKRLFDRAEELRVMCDRFDEIADANQFHRWTKDLKSGAGALRHSFDSGPFDADSLMAKCMKSALTAEQAAKYARFEATPPYQAPKRRPAGLEGAIELPHR